MALFLHDACCNHPFPVPNAARVARVPSISALAQAPELLLIHPSAPWLIIHCFSPLWYLFLCACNAKVGRKRRGASRSAPQPFLLPFVAGPSLPVADCRRDESTADPVVIRS
uniref:Uncharacterized protein n=1 Tax=Hemiselmis andersenii TaxID=464988 RepID=A0A6T8N228_HEMAN